MKEFGQLNNVQVCKHGTFKYGQCANCLAEVLEGSKIEIIEGKIPELRNLGDCLDEAKATICGERQDQYGSPEDSFALVAKYWNTYLGEASKLAPKDIAHMMILFKMARVQGQAPKRDNYVDICGYAAIAADRF